jgi:hypothetical protein
MKELKKPIGACESCVYFAKQEPHFGDCMVDPPVIIQHLVKLCEDGACASEESIMGASVRPIVYTHDFCSRWVDQDDFNWDPS